MTRISCSSFKVGGIYRQATHCVVGHVEEAPAIPDTETKVVGKPWQNVRNNRDVTDDGNVVPIDVLVVINEINGRNFSDPLTGKLNDRPTDATFYFDVNGDTFATSNDALVIINFLNAQAGEGESETELFLASSWALKSQLELVLPFRSLELERSAHSATAAANKTDPAADVSNSFERDLEFGNSNNDWGQDSLSPLNMEAIQDLDEHAWDELLSALCLDGILSVDR